MIYTSNFASLKKLAESKVEPICIAVGKPRWFKGKSYLNLAPTRPMLKMDPDQYKDHLQGQPIRMLFFYLLFGQKRVEFLLGFLSWADIRPDKNPRKPPVL